MSIQTTISMYNAVSPVLSSVVESMDQVILSAQQVNAKTGDMISTESLANAQISLQEASQGIEQMTQKQEEFNQEVEKSSGMFDGLKGKIFGVIGAYAGIQSIKKLVNLSDEMAQTEAMIERVKGAGETLAGTQQMVYEAAQRSRGSYQDMLDSATKLKLLTGDNFSTMEETVRFSELLSKSFKLGKTTLEEQNAAMHQLTQAMASGRLQGDEFVSILENAPILMQYIADSMGVTRGELKELSSEGKITADVIKKAIFEAGEEINAEFSKVPMTFAEIRQSVVNDLIMGIQPALMRLNEFMNSASFMTFVNNFTIAASMMAGVLGLLIEGFIHGFNIIANVIDAVQIPLMGLAIVTGIYYGAVLAGLAIEKTRAAITAVTAGVTALLSAETRMATLAQWGFNTAILASPLFWIPALIIGVIVLISSLIFWTKKAKGETVSAIGVVTGVLAAAISAVANLLVGLANHAITVAENMTNTFIRFGEFLANFAKHPLQASLRLFQQFANSVLNILSNVASTIDSIFGSNLASIVGSFQSNVGAWVNSQLSSDYEKFNEVKFDRIQGVGNIGQAYKKGYEWGESKASSIEERFDPKSRMDEKLMDEAGLAQSIGNETAKGLGGKGVGDKVGDIANATKGIDKKLDQIDWKNNNLDSLKGLMETRAITDISKDIKLEVYNQFTGNVENDVDVKDIARQVTDSIFHQLDLEVQGG